jgi:hypothetical protein
MLWLSSKRQSRCGTSLARAGPKAVNLEGLREDLLVALWLTEIQLAKR